MIAEGIFIVVLGIFILKILWNLILAYALVFQLSKEGRTETRSVSFMPVIEILALGTTVGVSVFIDDGVPLFGNRSVLLFGSAAIVLSYIHLVVVGTIGGYIVSRLR